MCFGKPSVPDTGAELRAQEEERRGRINAGTQQVNQTFERFGPEYFRGIGESFRGFYRPQLEDQYGEAKRQTTFRYAGNPNSSAANRGNANLTTDYNRNLQSLESNAFDAEARAKGEVEQRRASLLNLLEAGSGIENVASQANAIAQQQIGRPTFEPLGDLFGKYANTLGNYSRAQGQGYAPVPFYQNQVDFLRGGRSSGSQRVIGG
jgi:hypothetical protein